MEKNICGAKTRPGTPCARQPARGRTRCRLHGGATPRGRASPHFKTGKYSSFLPERLIARYEEGQADPDLRSFDRDIATLEVRIHELRQQLVYGSPESKPIWEMMAKAIMVKSRVLGQQSKLLVDKRQMISVERLMTLLAAIQRVISRHVPDPQTRAAINEAIHELLEREVPPKEYWRADDICGSQPFYP